MAQSFWNAARPTRPGALTAAERARTLLAGCSTVRVRLPGVTLEVHRHGLTPDGSLLFQAPAELTLSDAEATAVDVSAVPQPDRVRGTVVLHGRLNEVTEALPVGLRAHLTGSEVVGGSRLVRLAPDRVLLDWRCEQAEGGEVEIGLPSYRVAFPDPLLGYETEWLPHLQADHAELLEVLACHELGIEDDDVDVRAVGLDRYGVVLRVLGVAVVPGSPRTRSYDVRIRFDQPITCGCDVRQAFSALLERAAPGIGPVC